MSFVKSLFKEKILYLLMGFIFIALAISYDIIVCTKSN